MSHSTVRRLGGWALWIVSGALAPGLSAARAEDVGQITDINPGSAGSCPSYLTVFNDVLYFRANSAPHGNDTELWSYDGVAAQRAADVVPGPNGSSPADLTVHGGYLYFAGSDATGSVKMWRYDGASASLAPFSGPTPTVPQEFISYGGALYFRAALFGAQAKGIELWKYDGTSLTVFDLFPGSGSSYPQHFIEFNGLLYFNANITPGQGTELVRFNGTRAAQVTSICPGGASPEQFVIFQGNLYFSARDCDASDQTQFGRELWRFDGATATRVTDINPGTQSSNPNGCTVYRDAIYFGAENGIDGYELWRYDGSQAEMVANINPTPPDQSGDPIESSFPGDFIVYDDRLYFSADDGTHGRELWCYDGESVYMVADINPGPYGSYVSGFQIYQDRLYFNADDGQSGGELGQEGSLWRLSPALPPNFVRGDCNGDGQITGMVADAVAVLVYNFLGGPEPDCLAACDVNGDGQVAGQISDAVYLLQYNFLDGPEPPAPYPACGPGSAGDTSLGCAVSPAGCP